MCQYINNSEDIWAAKGTDLFNASDHVNPFVEQNIDFLSQCPVLDIAKHGALEGLILQKSQWLMVIASC